MTSVKLIEDLRMVDPDNWDNVLNGVRVQKKVIDDDLKKINDEKSNNSPFLVDSTMMVSALFTNEEIKKEFKDILNTISRGIVNIETVSTIKLNAEIKQLELENKTLKETVTLLTGKTTTTDDKKEIARLNQTVLKYKSEIETAKDSFSKLTSRYNDLVTKYEQLGRDNIELARVSSGLRTERDTLKSKADGLVIKTNDQIVHLREEKAKFDRVAEENKILIQKNFDQETNNLSKIMELNKNLATSNESIQLKDLKLGTLERDLEQSEEDNQSLRSQLKKCTEDYETLKEQLENAVSFATEGGTDEIKDILDLVKTTQEELERKAEENKEKERTNKERKREEDRIALEKTERVIELAREKEKERNEEERKVKEAEDKKLKDEMDAIDKSKPVVVKPDVVTTIPKDEPIDIQEVIKTEHGEWKDVKEEKLPLVNGNDTYILSVATFNSIYNNAKDILPDVPINLQTRKIFVGKEIEWKLLKNVGVTIRKAAMIIDEKFKQICVKVDEKRFFPFYRKFTQAMDSSGNLKDTNGLFFGLDYVNSETYISFIPKKWFWLNILPVEDFIDVSKSNTFATFLADLSKQMPVLPRLTKQFGDRKFTLVDPNGASRDLTLQIVSLYLQKVIDQKAAQFNHLINNLKRAYTINVDSMKETSKLRRSSLSFVDDELDDIDQFNNYNGYDPFDKKDEIYHIESKLDELIPYKVASTIVNAFRLSFMETIWLVYTIFSEVFRTVELDPVELAQEYTYPLIDWNRSVLSSGYKKALKDSGIQSSYPHVYDDLMKVNSSNNMISVFDFEDFREDKFDDQTFEDLIEDV